MISAIRHYDEIAAQLVENGYVPQFQIFNDQRLGSICGSVTQITTNFPKLEFVAIPARGKEIPMIFKTLAEAFGYIGVV